MTLGKFINHLHREGYLIVKRNELNRLYSVAYHEGHNDTCESVYVDVLPNDMDTYHEDAVQNFLNEL